MNKDFLNKYNEALLSLPACHMTGDSTLGLFVIFEEITLCLQKQNVVRDRVVNVMSCPPQTFQNLSLSTSFQCIPTCFSEPYITWKAILSITFLCGKFHY